VLALCESDERVVILDGEADDLPNDHGENRERDQVDQEKPPLGNMRDHPIIPRCEPSPALRGWDSTKREAET
jgi:hypothetical protein